MNDVAVLVGVLVELLLELLVVNNDVLLLVPEDTELVLIELDRLLVEVMLPVVELELEELEELLGGPAEYTTAPAG